MRNPQLGRKAILVDESTARFLGMLRSLRMEQGYTQKELAVKIGVRNQCVLSRYETGSKLPQLGHLIRLAKILNYDLSSSLNYKFFYGELDAAGMRAKELELSCEEFANCLKFSKRSISDALHMTKDTSVMCVAAILGYFAHGSHPSGEQELPKFSPENLRDCRKARGLSQRDLAKLSGLCECSIVHYEVGRTIPKKASWRRICEALAREVTPRLYKLRCGACYRIKSKRSITDGQKQEVNYTFRYCGRKGIHYVFREVVGGWTRTYTDAQLIGRKIEEVKHG